MKNWVLLILSIFVYVSLVAQNTGKYQLVWQDEFDYKGLPDSAKWNFDTRGNKSGWGNNELQVYTKEELKNASVSDGTLKLTALKENLSSKKYSSARLRTIFKGDWLYGRFEIKAKLPNGRGLWPAIWMLPTDWEYGGWPKSGEIDIMENVGYDADTIVCSVHTGKYNHNAGTQKSKKVALKDNREVFHIYAVEWDEEKIKGFIDNDCYFTFEKESDDPGVWPFDKRFHLLLNIAVGGNWGGKEGIDDSIFPAKMEIDYVRVYQKQ